MSGCVLAKELFIDIIEVRLGESRTDSFIPSLSMCAPVSPCSQASKKISIQEVNPLSESHVITPEPRATLSKQLVGSIEVTLHI
jgi:hypothetical protein